MTQPLARVVLVTGKGGVGKTTLSASLAREAGANKGGSVLVEFGDGEAGRRVLGKNAKGVEHVVVTPLEAVVRAFGPLFGPPLLARAVIGNFAVKRFIRAAPVVRELATLETVRLIAAEHPKRSIFVDMPATGHGIAWLRVPQQFSVILESGPMLEMTRRISSELIAEGRCSIVVVTLPERLVIRETLELVRAIARDVGIPPARLVVNRFPVPLPEQALVDARALAHDGGPLARPAAGLAEALSARAEASAEALESLQEALASTKLTPVILPEHASDPSFEDVSRWLRREGLVT